jgi:hypothetical protein
MNQVYYEVIVMDVNDHKHRHLVWTCPDKNGDDYVNGELVLDLTEGYTITYFLDKIAYWSVREIECDSTNINLDYVEANL